MHRGTQLPLHRDPETVDECVLVRQHHARCPDRARHASGALRNRASGHRARERLERLPARAACAGHRRARRARAPRGYVRRTAGAGLLRSAAQCGILGQCVVHVVAHERVLHLDPDALYKQLADRSPARSRSCRAPRTGGSSSTSLEPSGKAAGSSDSEWPTSRYAAASTRRA